MNTFAIIPARGGSKAIPHKNIALLGGYPLIAYSIIAAKLSKKIERIIVSTDSEKIAEVAKNFGAEVPFLRPAEFARDDSPDIDCIRHALSWLRDHEGVTPEYVAHLRPTTPLRKPKDIDEAITSLAQHPEATSLRSGYEIRESPYKLFGIEKGFFTGLFPSDPRPEYWNLPRQAFPPVYQPDGYVDILKPAFIEKHATLHGNNILAFVSTDTGEIDRPEDLKFAEYKLQNETWEVYEWLKSNFSRAQ